MNRTDLPDPATVEVGSHLEIALAVAAGVADVGLGCALRANDLDLDFVLLACESFDAVLPESALGERAPRSRRWASSVI